MVSLVGGLHALNSHYYLRISRASKAGIVVSGVCVCVCVCVSVCLRRNCSKNC